MKQKSNDKYTVAFRILSYKESSFNLCRFVPPCLKNHSITNFFTACVLSGEIAFTK